MSKFCPSKTSVRRGGYTKEQTWKAVQNIEGHNEIAQCQDTSSTRGAVGQITFLLLRELCPGRSAKLPQQRLA